VKEVDHKLRDFMRRIFGAVVACTRHPVNRSIRKKLFPMVVGLRQWGEHHLFNKGEPHSTMIERDIGKPIQKMALRGHDGGLLGPDEMVVKKLGSAK
jgi:hypothetical protein